MCVFVEDQAFTLCLYRSEQRPLPHIFPQGGTSLSLTFACASKQDGCHASAPRRSREKRRPVAHGGLGEAGVETRVEEVFCYFPAVVAMRLQGQSGLLGTTTNAQRKKRRFQTHAIPREEGETNTHTTHRGTQWRCRRKTLTCSRGSRECLCFAIPAAGLQSVDNLAHERHRPSSPAPSVRAPTTECRAVRATP